MNSMKERIIKILIWMISKLSSQTDIRWKIYRESYDGISADNSGVVPMSEVVTYIVMGDVSPSDTRTEISTHGTRNNPFPR